MVITSQNEDEGICTVSRRRFPATQTSPADQVIDTAVATAMQAASSLFQLLQHVDCANDEFLQFDDEADYLECHIAAICIGVIKFTLETKHQVMHVSEEAFGYYLQRSSEQVLLEVELDDNFHEWESVASEVRGAVDPYFRPVRDVVLDDGESITAMYPKAMAWLHCYLRRRAITVDASDVALHSATAIANWIRETFDALSLKDNATLTDTVRDMRPREGTPVPQDQLPSFLRKIPSEAEPNISQLEQSLAKQHEALTEIFRIAQAVHILFERVHGRIETESANLNSIWKSILRKSVSQTDMLFWVNGVRKQFDSELGPVVDRFIERFGRPAPSSSNASTNAVFKYMFLLEKSIDCLAGRQRILERIAKNEKLTLDEFRVAQERYQRSLDDLADGREKAQIQLQTVKTGVNN